jgi:DNA-binding response OmpR family regulator
MTRVLMMDRNRALVEDVGAQCLKHKIPVRFTETFCDGVRQMLDTPVSLVLVEAALMRLPGGELFELLDTIAPGIPVVVRVEADGAMDDEVRYEVQGFHVVRGPVDILELLAKADRQGRKVSATPAVAAAAVEAVCRQWA